MLKRMRRKGWGKAEAAWLGIGALLVFGAIAAFGYPSIKTSHTERVEKHVTTTERIPATARPTPQRRRQMSAAGGTRRDLRTLRTRVVELRSRVRAEARAAVGRYCAAHDGCRGEHGEKGAKGDDGMAGAPGKDGRNAPPPHELDSSLIDGVDNRVRDLEAVVSSLIGRLDGLQQLIGVLCRILTPGRC